VYEYILSGSEYGHRPFRIKAKLCFFSYSLHRGGIDNGNAGIVFGWKQTDGACSYLNLLFTGSRILLEEVGSAGRDAYFDFQHLDAGSEFEIEEGRQYVIVLSVDTDFVTVHVDNVMIYSAKTPRDPRGKVGLRPWRARIECGQFDVMEL
jgi:hypothetical protein